MYDFFEGEVVEKRPATIVLAVNGVGYRFLVPLSTSEAVPRSGTVRLFTHLHVREDALKLYGFCTAEERTAFQALISVTGVGPAVAITVLSGISVAEFLEAIEARDEARLRRVRGIGPKIAQRILFELSESLPLLLSRARLGPSRPAPRSEDALLALQSLGFTQAVAEKAVKRALGEAQDGETVEALVRRALRFTA